MRKTIWMNDPLLDLKEQLDAEGLGQKQGRAGGFSQRLGDIVERYQVIMELTPVIDLTDDEKMVIGECVCDGRAYVTRIRRLHDWVLDVEGITTPEKLMELHNKLKDVDAAGRIAIMESLGF